MKNFHRLIGIVLLALALSACDQIPGLTTPPPAATAAPIAPDPNLVIVEGRVIPRDSASLFFAAPGRVEELLVAEGDEVEAGQVLARLAEREQAEAAVTLARLELVAAEQQIETLNETADLLAAQAEVEALSAARALLDAQQRLADLDTDDTQQELDDANVRVNDLKLELDDAQKEADKYVGVDPDNADRQAAEDELEAAQDDYDQAVRDRDELVLALDQARAAVELAQARLDEAGRARDERQSGPDPDERDLAEARLANARAQVAAAEAALANLEIVAPFAGTIVKLDIVQGERAVSNQPVMVLADVSEWYVETTDLTENEVVRVEVGQTGQIVPDALPDLELEAEVESIAQTFTEKAGDVLYRVRLRLLDTDDQLRWGLTVEIRLDSSGR